MFLKLKDTNEFLNAMKDILKENDKGDIYNTHISKQFKVLTECNNFRSLYILYLLFMEVKEVEKSSYKDALVNNGKCLAILSNADIGELLGFNTTEVRTAIRKLEEFGYIENITDFNKGAFNKTNIKVYSLTDKGYDVIENK